MVTLLKALALQLIAGRTVGGVFTLLLAVLAPLAAVLKFIGLPILLVLGVVGAPVFLLLGALGLPAILIVGIGGSIMVVVGLLLAVGFTVLKIALPIILLVWFVRWIMRRHSSEPVVKEATAE
jgi:hypothetical protein